MNTPRTRLFFALAVLVTVAASPLKAAITPPRPTNFFTPQVFVGDVGNGYEAYYLDYFKYYAYQPEEAEYIYKFNFGFLYYFSPGSTLSTDEAYFYDFTSKDYFYTSAGLYPYLYSFNRNTFLYYFEGSNPREFYDFNAGGFIDY